MADPVFHQKNHYTYADYLTWPEEQRWEIIEGEAFNMSPAPSVLHQKISRNLFLPLGLYFEEKDCEVFSAPFDVVLPEKEETKENASNVVQPDIIIVCEPEKLDEQGCNGAPTLVIEILSQETYKKDLREKISLYEKHGVKECWIIFPETKTIEVYRLKNTKPFEYKRPTYYVVGDTIQPGGFPGLEINLEKVFASI
jgi:Uma2 family endonuclease